MFIAISASCLKTTLLRAFWLTFSAQPASSAVTDLTAQEMGAQAVDFKQ
jgi:sulfur relay (sulfurtransferase) DsrC/TusE family protein